jgi:hypothetical protein
MQAAVTGYLRTQVTRHDPSLTRPVVARPARHLAKCGLTLEHEDEPAAAVGPRRFAVGAETGRGE